MVYNKNNLDLSRLELIIISNVLNNVLSLTTEEEKNQPFSCYQQVETIAKKINEYLKK
jgi:hypothetical protein